MLREIAHLISKHRTDIGEGTLFVYDITITDETEKIIQYLESKNAIENSNYKATIGKIINLELTLARLNSIGYYEDVDALVRKNRYEYPSDIFYIKELDQFSDGTNTGLLLQYQKIIEFIDAIKQIAKHTFQDTGVDIAIIFRDDKSLILPFHYSSEDVFNLLEIKSIEFISNALKEANSEKKQLFVNELIDMLVVITEEERFSTILSSILTFEDKCNNAYQFYLRDFSYNKLKIELDSKALEFTQKIQSVINDSQTKLVTIPTAFVLVFVAFDFDNLLTVKNVASIMSLFIFAIIIQIFLNNQYSVLRFTKTNIDAYKETFKQNNIEKILEKFTIVDAELKKQRNRLHLVTVILWLIPVALFIVWALLQFLQDKLNLDRIFALILKLR